MAAITFSAFHLFCGIARGRGRVRLQRRRPPSGRERHVRAAARLRDAERLDRESGRSAGAADGCLRFVLDELDDVGVGVAAECRLAELVGDRVVLQDVERGKYAGRVVADVILPDGRSAAAVLLAEGIGRPYDGRSRREGWC